MEEPNVYIHAIRIGDSADSDRHYSYFDDANRQLMEACDSIKNDEKLKDGFNLIGLSQGGLMSRALVHRCTGIKVHRLITMGSPLMGVMAFPGCGMSLEKGWYSTRLLRSVMNRMRETILSCSIINAVVGRAVYSTIAQARVMPAQYFKDPSQLETYRTVNSFLADINNERTGFPINLEYRKNFLKLDKLIVFSFAQEEVVVPAESTVS